MSWIGRISDCLDAGRRGLGVEALAEVLPQDWVRDALDACGIRTRRRRRLPCEMTVWLVVLLSMFRRHSYLNLLEMLKGSRWAETYWSSRPPPCSSALTKARDRVGVEPLAQLWVGDDRDRASNAGDVERLAGSDQCDRPVGDFW